MTTISQKIAEVLKQSEELLDEARRRNARNQNMNNIQNRRQRNNNRNQSRNPQNPRPPRPPGSPPRPNPPNPAPTPPGSPPTPPPTPTPTPAPNPPTPQPAPPSPTPPAPLPTLPAGPGEFKYSFKQSLTRTLLSPYERGFKSYLRNSVEHDQSTIVQEEYDSLVHDAIAKNHVPVFKNPSKDEIRELSKDGHSVATFLSHDGNLYLTHGSILHDNLIRHLGLPIDYHKPDTKKTFMGRCKPNSDGFLSFLSTNQKLHNINHLEFHHGRVLNRYFK